LVFIKSKKKKKKKQTVVRDMDRAYCYYETKKHLTTTASETNKQSHMLHNQLKTTKPKSAHRNMKQA
jgi:hypothetical protein